MHFIAFSFFVICRWSFGVVLYEIFTVGTSESSKYITVLSLKKRNYFVWTGEMGIELPQFLTTFLTRLI